MARNGDKTRKTIMDTAEALILEQGFSGSSIDRIIDRAGIPKGTFFYHFPSKPDLAQALVERFARRDLHQLTSKMEAAEQQTEDPARQLIVFLAQFEALADEWTAPYPGCLFATFCCESGLFEDRTLAVMRETMLTWRSRIAAKLRAAAASTPPRAPVDVDSLADSITVVFEGSFIVSRTLNDPKTVARQLRHLQTYLRLLFGLEADTRPA